MAGMREVNSSLEALKAITRETQELLKQDTAAKQKTNSLLSEYTEKIEERNEHLAVMEAAINEIQRLIEELREESTDGPIAHAPAD